MLQEIADAMVSSGLRDAGCAPCSPAGPPIPPPAEASAARPADKYVNLDDGWAIGRHPNGTLIYDPELFPHGIKPVADYVHSKDMLFGICAHKHKAFPHSRRDPARPRA